MNIKKKASCPATVRKELALIELSAGWGALALTPALLPPIFEPDLRIFAATILVVFACWWLLYRAMDRYIHPEQSNQQAKWRPEAIPKNLVHVVVILVLTLMLLCFSPAQAQGDQPDQETSSELKGASKQARQESVQLFKGVGARQGVS